MTKTIEKTKLKIKKGDQVIVTTGSNKGSKGEVVKILRDKNRVVVQGVNLLTHYRKPTQSAPGAIEKIEGSISISNVALVDPKSGGATKVGYKTLKDGTKVRVAKASGETIDK
jgi:large subunit ribosomal protein L24